MKFDKWVELINKSDVDYSITQFDFKYNIVIMKRDYGNTEIVGVYDSSFPDALKRSANKLKEYLKRNKY